MRAALEAVGGDDGRARLAGGEVAVKSTASSALRPDCVDLGAKKAWSDGLG